ncbi:hypothetical protein GYMLUDRAFT_56349 [Collybiopsis luxurians FD-317 M1]|nr:hypothetical protein GYMLUDRAFT_56349 [Collybiopsis luxurians FD-317 M1]
MPRIRKKTSKRGTTNERRKISQKVRESRKKKTKAAKKSTEWKSRHKKDPGIPNTFPYKDQILAEVAEQRRVAAEEKQRRKDEKRALKSSATNEGKGGAEPETADVVEAQDDVGFEGIASISAKRLTAKATSRPVPQLADNDEDEDEEIPILINKDLPHLKAVLDAADAVVEVLDARDPLAFRSEHLEKEIAGHKKGKKVMLVVNKIDCAPQESVTGWISALRKQYPAFPFRSASSFIPGNPLIPSNQKGKGKAKDPVDDALGADAILKCLNKWASEKKGDEPFTVAVVGVTNTGKSSFINSLIKKQALEVYTLASSSRGPTTTTMPQELTTEVEQKILRFIDTPGFAWDSDKTSSEADEVRQRDILMRNKGRIDKLKDPLGPVAHLVSRANAEDLMLLYSLPAFPKGDVDAFVSGVARSQQLVRKRGALDMTGASKIVLRDWCVGKIRWFTTPPSSDSAVETVSFTTEDWLQSLYDSTNDVLANLETRKNMRRAGGLIKLSLGPGERRKVLTELLYTDVEGSSDEDDEEDDEDDGQMDVDDEDLGDENEDEEEDDDETEEDNVEDGEEEEMEVEPLVRSQKRKRDDQAPLPPKKKVTFAVRPQGSKGSKTSKVSSGPRPSATTIPPSKKGARPAPKKVK